jgi:hypothetical protein
VGK